MVSYIKSDLDFILAQIKIAEAHAAGGVLFDQNGPNSLGRCLQPQPGPPHCRRLVQPSSPRPGDMGRRRSAVPGTARSGRFRPAECGNQLQSIEQPGSLVIDSSLRTISNLIVDQTLGNPAPILTALGRAGSADPMADLAAVTTIYDGLQAGLRRGVPGARRNAERQGGGRRSSATAIRSRLRLTRSRSRSMFGHGHRRSRATR